MKPILIACLILARCSKEKSIEKPPCSLWTATLTQKIDSNVVTQRIETYPYEVPEQYHIDTVFGGKIMISTLTVTCK